MEKFIPLSIPNFEGNEEKYVLDAVKQGWVSTGGAYITQLEEKLADYLDVPMVAACQSGTSALHLSLIECDVRPNDLVIVPALTFIAAVNPVRYQFAEPIFMDCDDSLCMNPIKLRKFCETECEKRERQLIYKKTGQRIKTLIVVHVFGNLTDMEAIMEIAEEFHLYVIEDATEALGSKFLTGKYAGKMAGTIGDFGAYSFNGNKIITTGGGGAVTAASEKTAEHMKYLSTQAKDDTLYYLHNEVGYNYRMTNLQAALGLAQLEKLPEFIKRKKDNYHKYAELLWEFAQCSILPFRENTDSNHWFYSLFVDRQKVSKELQQIITELQETGIQVRPIWGLICEQKPYRNAIAYEIETAKYYSERIVNLPCSTQITEEEIEYVVEVLVEVLV
ncbi:MAG: LegC family aminotransferase [Lachnospiraceae bacterium]|nr:LegC family aminotransferase [Lachnospiraceae bacterium]